MTSRAKIHSRSLEEIRELNIENDSVCSRCEEEINRIQTVSADSPHQPEELPFTREAQLED